MGLSYILSFLKFCRWPNLLLIVILFFLFDQAVVDPLRTLSSLPRSLSSWQFAMLITDVLIVAMLGYWMNDFFDRKVDAINRPERFLVKYDLKESRLISLIIALAIIGAIITVYLGFTENKLGWTWIYPTVLLALYFYARDGKKWGIIGNSVVSLNIAVLPFLILLSEEGLIKVLRIQFHAVFTNLLIFFVFFSFLMFLLNLARELAKDAQDLEGDIHVNSSSVPISYGNVPTKTIITSILIFSGCLNWGSFVFFDHREGFEVYLIGLSLLIVYTAFIAAKANDSKRYSQVSGLMKFVMLGGLIELLFFRFI